MPLADGLLRKREAPFWREGKPKKKKTPPPRKAEKENSRRREDIESYY